MFSDLWAFEDAGEAFLAEGAARGERALFLDRHETLLRYGNGSLRDALRDGHTGLRGGPRGRVATA